MGFFDFLRKKQETKTIKIELDGLNKFMQDRKKENENREKELVLSIRNSLNGFIENIQEKINVLKNIDINSKKADPRARFVIRENLFHYIDNAEKLVRELKELEISNLIDYVKDIDSLFIEFEQKSRLNYEKATFLIGKELGEIRDAINGFIKNTKRLLDENKPLLDSIKIISSIEEKLLEFNGNEKTIEEISRKINESSLKIDASKGNILSTELEVEKIKSSDSYIQEMTIEADIKVRSEELEKEVYLLKDMINFKKLANMYHYDPKKMAIVNEYKLNFIRTFDRDKLLSLIPLLTEANMADSHLSKKTNDIFHKQKEIENIKNKSNKKHAGSLYDLNKRLSSFKSEIESLNQELQKDNKRKEKYEQARNEILAEIKKGLSALSVDLDTSLK